MGGEDGRAGPPAESPAKSEEGGLLEGEGPGLGKARVASGHDVLETTSPRPKASRGSGLPPSRCPAHCSPAPSGALTHVPPRPTGPLCPGAPSSGGRPPLCGKQPLWGTAASNTAAGDGPMRAAPCGLRTILRLPVHHEEACWVLLYFSCLLSNNRAHQQMLGADDGSLALCKMPGSSCRPSSVPAPHAVCRDPP